MYLIGLPAVLALVLKIFVLYRANKAMWCGRKWIILMIFFMGLNLTEVLIYFSVGIAISPEWLLKAYHLTCVFSLMAGVYYIADFENSIFQKSLVIALVISGFCVSIAILFGQSIIAGYLPGSMPVTSVKGGFYFSFLFFSLIGLVLALTLLFYNYVTAKQEYQKVAYGYSIIGLAPLIIVSLLIMGGKALGLEWNGSALIPLCTTLFLWVTSFARESSQIDVDPRVILSPKGERAQLIFNVVKAITQFSLGNITYKEAVATFERHLVGFVVSEHGGNISAASRSIDHSRDLVYRKIKPPVPD